MLLLHKLQDEAVMDLFLASSDTLSPPLTEICVLRHRHKDHAHRLSLLTFFWLQTMGGIHRRQRRKGRKLDIDPLALFTKIHSCFDQGALPTELPPLDSGNGLSLYPLRHRLYSPVVLHHYPMTVSLNSAYTFIISL